ncbi:uncharacterized protein LOC143437396 isoform X1 [Arvicanthis niloticus]|uniref:uncharacterized protein LOC143437396 isoform X1 n=1 Tax=Arvicanthis niloticus TaxID=61156 RepID=UPI00403CB314
MPRGSRRPRGYQSILIDYQSSRGSLLHPIDELEDAASSSRLFSDYLFPSRHNADTNPQGTRLLHPIDELEDAASSSRLFSEYLFPSRHNMDTNPQGTRLLHPIDELEDAASTSRLFSDYLFPSRHNMDTNPQGTSISSFQDASGNVRSSTETT